MNVRSTATLPTIVPGP